MGPRGWGPGWEGRWDLPAQFFRRRLKNLWNRPCLIESNSEKLSMLSPDLGPANRRNAPSKIHRGRVGHGGVAVESPPPESAARARSRYRPAFGPEVDSEPDAAEIAEIERRTALIRREKIMLDRVRRRGEHNGEPQRTHGRAGCSRPGLPGRFTTRRLTHDPHLDQRHHHQPGPRGENHLCPMRQAPRRRTRLAGGTNPLHRLPARAHIDGRNYVMCRDEWATAAWDVIRGPP